MSNNESSIVGVMNTRVDKDLKDRDKLVLTLGTPVNGPGAGISQVQALINALAPFVNSKVRLDIRTEQKETSNGRKFPASFLLVREVLTDGQAATAGAGNGQTTYVDAHAQTARVQESLGE